MEPTKEPTPPTVGSSLGSLFDALVGMRNKGVLAFALASTIAVQQLYPQQVGVLLFKFNVLALAAVAGYWLDRGLFPFARPSEENVEDKWMFRRAGIVAAAMLSAALAL